MMNLQESTTNAPVVRRQGTTGDPIACPRPCRPARAAQRLHDSTTRSRWSGNAADGDSETSLAGVADWTEAGVQEIAVEIEMRAARRVYIIGDGRAGGRRGGGMYTSSFWRRRRGAGGVPSAETTKQGDAPRLSQALRGGVAFLPLTSKIGFGPGGAPGSWTPVRRNLLAARWTSPGFRDEDTAAASIETPSTPSAAPPLPRAAENSSSPPTATATDCLRLPQALDEDAATAPRPNAAASPTSRACAWQAPQLCSSDATVPPIFVRLARQTSRTPMLSCRTRTIRAISSNTWSPFHLKRLRHWEGFLVDISPTEFSIRAELPRAIGTARHDELRNPLRPLSSSRRCGDGRALSHSTPSKSRRLRVSWEEMESVEIAMAWHDEPRRGWTKARSPHTRTLLPSLRREPETAAR